MSPSATDALSPVDGRYRATTEPLRGLLSESGLIRERIRVEALWLLHLLAATPKLPGGQLAPAVRGEAERLAREPPADAVERVKAIESRINHDVKAVEYYVRERLAQAGATPASLELVHFGCTSEDINNVCYARLLRAAREVLLEVLGQRQSALSELAQRYADLPMLARTHGQPASPTTLGKEFANFAARLLRGRDRLAGVRVLGKWNGAVGNFNAHVLALPEIDWLETSRRFIDALGLEENVWTTQIEPHDWIGEYCDALAAINMMLVDACRDLWGYVALGYLRQRAKDDEVGSSTMPHKVNPIDFENSEGNIGVANALLRHLSDKLPVSRWQRDLSDSTAQRNLGAALGHTLLAYAACLRGLGKLEADPARLAGDLEANWEVLAEAVQQVMRRHGVPEAYEKLKALSRGRRLERAELAAFVKALEIPDEAKKRLLALTPAKYTGLAAELAKRV